MCLLHLLLLGLLLWRCHGYHSHHHIYDEGSEEDSCSAADFGSTYWTSPGARGTQLLGTQHAQRLIWENQHPASCEGKSFLVWRACNHGIGSTWHIMGQVLAHAIAMARVLVLAPDEGHAFYDGQWCGPDSNYHDCYFHPVSSCTYEDAEAAAGGAAGMREAPHVSKPGDDVAQKRVVQLVCGPGATNVVPAALSSFPGAAAIHPDKLYYWWRAQSVAFLFRPNARTLGEMAARRREAFPQGAVPPGCISVHIRRGDKWTESPVTEDAVYAKTAEALHERGRSRFGITRSIFLSTEDPSAVAYFQALEGWNVSFTHVPRKPDTHKSTMEYAREIGPATEMINSLVRERMLP